MINSLESVREELEDVFDFESIWKRNEATDNNIAELQSILDNISKELYFIKDEIQKLKKEQNFLLD